jgi:hypothetical protein
MRIEPLFLSHAEKQMLSFKVNFQQSLNYAKISRLHMLAQMFFFNTHINTILKYTA